MAISTPSHAFISIFYAKSKWHELMPIIRTLLCENELIASNEVNIFLSPHQGSSIRVAVRNTGESSRIKIDKFIVGIGEYMNMNPSPIMPIELPVRSFFADFPNNVIKYNLFNERSFAPAGLSKFQIALSQLLLTFFDDHPIDDEGLFTLLVYLNRCFIANIRGNAETKLNLIKHLIRVIRNKTSDFTIPEVEDHFRTVISINSTSDFEQSLNWIKEASNVLLREVGDEIEAFLIFLQIIQLHLVKLDNSFFVDALRHLAEEDDVHQLNQIQELQYL